MNHVTLPEFCGQDSGMISEDRRPCLPGQSVYGRFRPYEQMEESTIGTERREGLGRERATAPARGRAYPFGNTDTVGEFGSSVESYPFERHLQSLGHFFGQNSVFLTGIWTALGSPLNSPTVSTRRDVEQRSGVN